MDLYKYTWPFMCEREYFKYWNKRNLSERIELDERPQIERHETVIEVYVQLWIIQLQSCQNVTGS